MFILSKSAEKMAAILYDAIRENKISGDDYEEIIKIADTDGQLDNQERSVLKALHELIANKLIARVDRCEDCERGKD